MEAAGIEPASCLSKGVSETQVASSDLALAAVWQRSLCSNCQSVARSDASELPPSVRFVAERWHLLPPHVREAVITLVDVATSNLEGGGA